MSFSGLQVLRGGRLPQDAGTPLRNPGSLRSAGCFAGVPASWCPPTPPPPPYRRGGRCLLSPLAPGSALPAAADARFRSHPPRWCASPGHFAAPVGIARLRPLASLGCGPARYARGGGGCRGIFPCLYIYIGFSRFFLPLLRFFLPLPRSYLERMVFFSAEGRFFQRVKIFFWPK